MQDIIRNLDRNATYLLATVFIGIHVPLVAIILYGIVSGFVGIGTLFLVVLLATLASTAISLTVCYGLIKSVRNTPAIA